MLCLQHDSMKHAEQNQQELQQKNMSFCWIDSHNCMSEIISVRWKVQLTRSPDLSQRGSLDLRNCKFFQTYPLEDSKFHLFPSARRCVVSWKRHQARLSALQLVENICSMNKKHCVRQLRVRCPLRKGVTCPGGQDMTGWGTGHPGRDATHEFFFFNHIVLFYQRDIAPPVRIYHEWVERSTFDGVRSPPLLSVGVIYSCPRSSLSVCLTTVVHEKRFSAFKRSSLFCVCLLGVSGQTDVVANCDAEESHSEKEFIINRTYDIFSLQEKVRHIQGRRWTTKNLSCCIRSWKDVKLPSFIMYGPCLSKCITSRHEMQEICTWWFT